MRGELAPKSRSRRHLLDQAIQSDAQIAILQRLWTERSDRPSSFAETLPGQIAGTTIVFLAFSRRAIGKSEFGRFQLDDYACESLGERVMDVAGHPVSFLQYCSLPLCLTDSQILLRQLPTLSMKEKHRNQNALKANQRHSTNNPPAIRFPHGWDAIQDDAAGGNTRQRDAPTIKLARVQHFHARGRFREWDICRILALENSQRESGCILSQRREADEIASNSSAIQNVFGVNVCWSVCRARNHSERVSGQERPPCTILREARKQNHGPRREITHPLQQSIYRKSGQKCELELLLVLAKLIAHQLLQGSVVG